MNGRCFAKAIFPSTWPKQKAVDSVYEDFSFFLLLYSNLLTQVLDDLFKSLDATEGCFKEKKGFSFLSPATLKAMRVSLLSTIKLTEEHLTRSKFKFVLTGKFNQDCVEV